MKWFTIKDQQNQGYGEPFPAETIGMAIRQIQIALKTPTSLMAQFPEDFSIFETAEFDPLTGRTVGLVDPKHVINVSELKEKQSAHPLPSPSEGIREIA